MSERKIGQPGSSGVVKSRKTYSGFFKAKVVSELIKGNRSLIELAEHYQLNPNQIKNWKSRLLKQAPYVLDDKRRIRKKVTR